MSEEAELSNAIKMHPCALCDVKTVKKADLIGHIIINHDIFPCDGCTYYFDTKESLKSHVLSEHKKGLSSCYELNKTESELFKCIYCEYTAKNQSRMKQHENGKHNTKMYKCKYCEFTAKYSKNVKRHENGNHLGISYKCSYCEYSAKQRRSIEDHEAAKHEGFRLNCPDCSFQSGFRQALEYHIKTRHFPSSSNPKL